MVNRSSSFMRYCSELLGCILTTGILLYLADVYLFPLPLFDVMYMPFLYTLMGVAVLLCAFGNGARTPTVSLPALLSFLFFFSLNMMTAQNKTVAFNTYWHLVIPLLIICSLGAVSYSWVHNKERAVYVFSLIVTVFALIVAVVAVGEVVCRVNILHVNVSAYNPYYARYVHTPSSMARPVSTQFNPAALATCMLFSLPFMYYARRYATCMRDSFLLLFSALLSIATLLLTASRGAFLGLGAMFFLMCCIKKKVKAMILGVLCIALFSFGAQYLPYPLVRFSPQWIVGSMDTAITSDYRAERFAMGIRMLRTRPLQGIGLGHVREEFHHYYSGSQSVDDIPYELRVLDNMYLTIMAETGLFGVSAFLLCLVLFYRKTFSLVRGDSRLSPPVKSFVYAAMAAGTGMLVAMAGYDLLYWPSQYMFFLFSCSCIFSISAEQGRGMHAL